MAEPDAHSLVAAARDVMRMDSAGNAGVWPRAAAMLGRQALEAAMQRVWELTAPGMEHANLRPQLLCIGPMLNDEELGRRVVWASTLLSGACHHSVYDLPLPAAELRTALETVWALADAADKLRASAGR